jgi:hypothetical protein
MKNLVYGILTILALTTCVCLAAPEPRVVPGPDEWTLDITYEQPEQIVMRVAGEPKRFWYMIVAITNNTGKDVDFYPKCELVTDTLAVIPSGKNVASDVFKKIKKRYQGKYPLLELLEEAGHKILEGKDNTKDIAIIWPDFDTDAKNIKLYIAGLSNETAVVDHPTEKDKDGKAVKVYLRKTLELSYDIGGDPALRSNAKLVAGGQQWVMR